MKLITLLGTIAAALALCFAAGASSGVEERKPVTVFLVRHAETAGSTKTERDPALSEEGRERAAALSRLLAKAGVTHLFASEFVRTGTTVGPLAEALGLEVKHIGAREGDAQAEALRALPPGSIAVVAGHSNTVPALVRKLGGGQLADLEQHATYGEMFPHDAYDRLVQVILPAAEGTAAQTIELRYGR
ncbi:MAG: phosphoglycerate mutase family protein [Planctomycetota bacterium]